MGKELRRMSYFDGLFLNAEDYKLDQEFHLRLQRLHNRYLHTWGIVCGLKVLPSAKPGESMKVSIAEGLALNLVLVKNGDKYESISQEILIYEGHPDNPVNLSEYNANENIYIWVSYEEVGAERSIERGQGEQIHIWEREKSVTEPLSLRVPIRSFWPGWFPAQKGQALPSTVHVFTITTVMRPGRP